ncbi:MAG TPA: STAS domain-containing protein [Terriglobia bacterium]|nr:STAS domain-containing protein [Terriglobia bacterium]
MSGQAYRDPTNSEINGRTATIIPPTVTCVGTRRAEQASESNSIVLKITTLLERSKCLKVSLCGQFTGEYVPELQKTLSPEKSDAEEIALDLSNVTFVDREAMVFLCGARSRNIAIENMPSYVIRWIEQEGRCASSRPEPFEK